MISRRAIVRLAGLGAGGAAIFATGASRRGGVRAQSEDPPAAPDDHAVHWTYEGDAGPDHWGELDPAYGLCSHGTAQSPIDIDRAAGEDLADIEFAYNAISPVQLVNNGHTVQVAVPPGNGITLDRAGYELKQFHFHTPSEHTIAGQAQAMELHLVHVADDETIAVVGALLAEGSEHGGLAAVFSSLPRDAEVAVDVETTLDLNALLPEVQTTYRYLGSLTTPPCSEGVHWLLFTQPEEVSARQVTAFRRIFAVDARPVQPRNERVIQQDTAA